MSVISMLCANEAALRRYMRTVDQEERRLTAIENRAADLLLTEYSPAAMAGEALGELNPATMDGIELHIAALGRRMDAIEKARHYEFIGRLIAGAVDNYAAGEARKQAEREVENAECQHCFGFGCRFCDPEAA